MLRLPYPVFTRAPLVGSLDMDYWCSAFETKGAHVNTGYGSLSMFDLKYRKSFNSGRCYYSLFDLIGARRLSQNAKCWKCFAPDAFSGAKFQVFLENGHEIDVG